MASKDKGHYGAKHSGGVVVANEITEAVKKRSRQGALTCPLAFKIAVPRELAVLPGEVGKAMDLLEINIVKCQLGLFGYSPVRKIVPPAQSVSEELEAALRKAMSNGRLPCAEIFRIAGEFKLAKIRVSSACEKLKIRISACQLGAFCLSGPSRLAGRSGQRCHSGIRLRLAS